MSFWLIDDFIILEISSLSFIILFVWKTLLSDINRAMPILLCLLLYFFFWSLTFNTFVSIYFLGDRIQLTPAFKSSLLVQGSANFFCKGLDSNNFRLSRPYSFCPNYSICCCSTKAVSNNPFLYPTQILFTEIGKVSGFQSNM